MKKLHSLFAIQPRPRLSLREQGELIKRLALYVRAGVPLLEALDLISHDPGTRSRTHILTHLQFSLREGVPLSHALSSFPSTFTPSAIGLIAAGESSGTLSRSLERLATHITRASSERNSVLQALAYPLLLLVAAASIIGFLVAGVFPRLQPLLTALDVPLPLATRALIGLSNFSGALAAVFVGGGAFLLGFAAWTARRRHAGLLTTLRRVQYGFPGIGSAMRHRSIAHMCESLSTMLSSGMRLEQALGFAAQECRYPALVEVCIHSQQQSLEGIPLSLSLRGRGAQSVIPVGSLALIATGERTGQLPHCLSLLAEIHTDTAQKQLAIIARLAEPVLMAVIAGAVGFVAYAILGPLYGITSRIGTL